MAASGRSPFDPAAQCSGCERVHDFLEASHYYALDLRRAGQPFDHVVPDTAKDICESSYLRHYKSREDVFGLVTFVHGRGSIAGTRGPLNDLCNEIHDANPLAFQDVLAKGEDGGRGLCQAVCERWYDMNLTDKLRFAAHERGGAQLLRLAPYAIIAALFVFLVLHYLHSVARRALAWAAARFSKKKKKT